MTKRKKLRLQVLIGAFAAIMLYVFLHESGHCIVAIMCGSKITEFSFMPAHMAYSGGSFTDFSYALFHMAGILFPYTISLLYALIYPINKTKKILLKAFSVAFCGTSVGTLFSGIVIPIMYLTGTAPQGDDMTKLLDILDIPPIIISVIALLLCFISITILIFKHIPQTFYHEMKALKSNCNI